MGTPYSEAEKQWLRENAPICSYDKLAPLLFEKFGRKVRPETLCEYCRVKLGIDKHEQFGFKKANIPYNTMPIGAEKVQKGSVYVKVSATGDRKKDWIPKTKLVYGEVPKRHILVFLDGNSINVTRENLYCVEQRVHARLAKNRWFSTDPMITLTAIRWCEHFYALKDFKERNK